jgi:hypothetical protein
MSIHALSLHSADPDFCPPPDFADQLRLLNFLGDEFDYFGHVRFRPGASFFDLIRFERTHNVIELKPTDDGLTELPPQDSRNFVQIELSSSDETGVMSTLYQPTIGRNIRFLTRGEGEISFAKIPVGDFNGRPIQMGYVLVYSMLQYVLGRKYNPRRLSRE